MNVSRFDLEDFLGHITVKTYSRLHGQYEHTVYSSNASSSADTSNRHAMSFATTAFRSEGLCYTTSLPEEITKAGVASVRFGLISDAKFDMTANTDFWVLGWAVLLHHKGQMRRSSKVVRIGAKSSYQTSAVVAHSIFR